MNKEDNSNIADLVINSDIDLSDTWLFSIIKEMDIPFDIMYVNNEFMYEVEHKPKNIECYSYRYYIHYDTKDSIHQFNRYLIKKYSEFINKLQDNFLEESEGNNE